MIKDLEQEKVYKYFGVEESSGTQHSTMNQKLKKELVRGTPLNPKTELYSKNRITVINMLAIPVITCSFNIIDWNLVEVKTEVKTRQHTACINQRPMSTVFTSQEVTGGEV